MLSKEKISKNAKKFHETGVKYEVVNDELMNMLGSEFISAPSTTSTNFNGAYEGGLIHHILQTTKYALLINENLPADKQVNANMIVRTCLIYQIGKAKMFVPQTSEWHRKNRGEMYTFNEEQLSMSASERSVFYALKSGIELTENEVYAIYNYNSDFAHKELNNDGDKMAAILRVANQMAVIEGK